MPVEQSILEKYKGWHVRIVDPNDEGYETQGSVKDVSVNTPRHGFPRIVLDLEWARSKQLEDLDWGPPAENERFVIPTDQDHVQKLAREGLCVFTDNEVVVRFIDPGSGEVISKS